jgi:hypothetical protein
MGKTWTNRTKDRYKRKERFDEYDTWHTQEFRACNKKKFSFDSERAAQRHIDEQPENFTARTYKCKFCDRWHLTTKEQTMYRNWKQGVAIPKGMMVYNKVWVIPEDLEMFMPSDEILKDRTCTTIYTIDGIEYDLYDHKYYVQKDD